MSDLPWRPLKGSRDVDLGEDMLELEEVEDVEVVYEDTNAGRVAKFRVCQTHLAVSSSLSDVQTDDQRPHIIRFRT
jgi:hypothetical protein